MLTARSVVSWREGFAGEHEAWLVPVVATSSTRDLPSGTVTFLFTDVEGSTRLLHELGEEALRRGARRAFGASSWRRARDDGWRRGRHAGRRLLLRLSDRARGARSRSVDRRRRLPPVRSRCGSASTRGLRYLTEEGYVGHDVHLAARLAASAHGGQVVLTKGTAALVDGEWPLRDTVGEHRLKDLAEAVDVFQLGEEGFSPLATTPSLPSSIDFRILGPLEVVAAEGPLALGGHKQRALLGLLLIRAGEVVSNDRLVQELWGEQPPRDRPRAPSTTFVVEALRKLLGPDVLVTRPPGYVLCIEAVSSSTSAASSACSQRPRAQSPRASSSSSRKRSSL